MNMKYLKKFENFSDEEIMKKYEMEDVCEPCDDKEEDDELYSAMGEEDEEEEVENITLEKKKLPAGLKAYLDKKKKGGESKSKSKKGNFKPDFLDLDKDGDKEEPMKKAAKEAKKK
jgi:hypothetical protein